MKFIILLIVALLLTICAYAGETVPMPQGQSETIANAIYKIEGGDKTKFPYGIKSIKTSNPRQVCINTIKNNYVRWQRAGSRGDYLNFLAGIYCPKSADPKGYLNWCHNIHSLIKSF